MTAPAVTPAAPLPGAGKLFVAQGRYQLRLLVRTPRALFAGVLLPVLLLVLRRTNGRQFSSSVELALVGGLAVFGAISVAYVTHAGNLVNAREAGVLRRWRVSPMPPTCFFAARIAVTVVLAVAGAVVTVLVARFTGTAIGGLSLLVMLLPLTLGALAWSALGTAATALIPNANSGYPVLAATYLPVIFLSGGIVPSVSTGPKWLTTLMSYLPAQPVIDGVTRALHTTPGFPSLHDVLVLSAWMLAGVAIALRTFSWSPKLQ